MCNFVSWIEYEGKNYFLQNDDLKTKQGKKLLKEGYKDDIMGHGAIAHYYNVDDKIENSPLYKGGKHRECEDFSTPNNFPEDIAKALIEGRLSKIGIVLDVLNKAGKAKYIKIEQTAWAEYDKIEQTAWAEYRKIKQSAYNKIVQQKKYRSKEWKM